MNDFAPWRHSGNVPGRFFIPALLVFLAIGAAAWPPARWTLILLIPLVALTVWDFFQRRHALRRNYPLVARVRWIMEDLRPYLRSYVVESNLDGRPFNHDARSLIYARAKGELDTHPFGTELDVYSEEYEWLAHSMAPNAAAAEQWRVTVGEGRCKQPYSAALLNISAMSFGSLSANAIMALNKGAAAGGFYHDTGEGGVSRYHRTYGGDLVWEIGSGYFGCRDSTGRFDPARFADMAQIDQVRMIEIKLSQGAKPGHGGVLPGAKVSAEIAAARGVAVGEDCVSPAAHSAFSTPVELLEWADRLRELAGGKPVGIKLCVGHAHEVFALTKAMLETGLRLDFITVDGAEGGTGTAPVELSNRVGMPLREGLILMRNALVGTGLKQDIRLAAAGKVHSGAGMAVNFALGADWCNAARAFMFALGCVQSMRCHTDTCPTGIATQDPTRQRGLVVPNKAERVARFQRQTLNGLREIVVAMGLDNPWQIGPDHLSERVNSTRSDSIDRIYPFLEEGQLLAAPDSTPYGLQWARARPDSFRRGGAPVTA
jgi:glutamate synthase domain-containing protein 2